jgi:two-component system sensor histidine kinase KdpD
MVADFRNGIFGVAGVCLVIAAMRAAQTIPNPTISALLLLLVVLATATAANLKVAVAVSVAAMLAFNYFLLPPFSTLTIADPQNWVALMVFLAVAIVASNLSGALRQRRLESLTRQRDLERLYAFGRSLLLFDNDAALPPGIARAMADAFELAGVALYDHQTGVVSLGGATDLSSFQDKLREVARNGKSFQDASGLVTAIRLGGAPIGSLAIVGGPLSDTVLQSLSNLVAIGLERARGQAVHARAEASRQSSELRAAVLDAAAHEFKTPLTSMKAAATALTLGVETDDPRRELIDIVNEGLSQLEALVSDAVQMLRIDAGDFIVNRERHCVADIAGGVLREFGARLNGHTVANGVAPDLMVDADRALLQLALRQLLDNALKYSSATSTIELSAVSNGALSLTVRNTGSTIPEDEQARLVERFYRGERARGIPGTGMGLAIVRQIAEAHGGTLTVASSEARGTEFTLSIPRGDRSN